MALVLGCARVLPNGSKNLYFKARIEAVTALWESGQIKHVHGYTARDIGGQAGVRTKSREELARVKAVLDMKVLKTEPKFRGEPVPIVSAES